MRLWLHQGMGRDVPLPHDCPACRASLQIDHMEAAAARLAARIEREHRAARIDRMRDDPVARPPVGPGASR